MLRFSGLYQENCSDLYVTCQVFAEGKPLALPVRTSYKAFSTRWKWVSICLSVVCAAFSNVTFVKSKLCFSLQLERVVAVAREVPGPSPKCPGGSDSVGHLWTGQRRPCRGNHCHPVWQIWVRWRGKHSTSFEPNITETALLLSSMFRQGMHDLKVWPGVEGDGGDPTATPGRTSSTLTEDQMGRLAKVTHSCAFRGVYMEWGGLEGWAVWIKG